MDPREPDGSHLGRGLTRRGGESILRAVRLGKRMSQDGVLEQFCVPHGGVVVMMKDRRPTAPEGSSGRNRWRAE